MNHEEKREYGDFVRMLVFAIYTAKKGGTKVLVEFTYGHKNTPKAKKPHVTGRLLVVDFPNIRVRDDDGWTKQYRIDKIEHDTFRQKLEDGSEIENEYYDWKVRKSIEETKQEIEQMSPEDLEEIKKDLGVKGEAEPTFEEVKKDLGIEEEAEPDSDKPD